MWLCALPLPVVLLVVGDLRYGYICLCGVLTGGIVVAILVGCGVVIGLDM